MSTRRWLLTAAVLGSATVSLDATVINVALPRIGRELHASLFGVLEGQSYVYNGYLLALGALLIPAGALGDRYGRRRIFAIGLAAFGVASLLCGLAPSLELLVAARVLQGGAGAMLVPGSLALLRANFEGEQQGRAIGTWAAASSATGILGPLLGGLLVDTLTWRLAFLANVPVVAVALFALLRHTPESRDSGAGGRRLDWLGAALSGLAVGGLSFGLIYGQQRQWRDPIGFVALAAGALAALALPLEMRRSSSPLVPLALFRIRDFNVTNLSTLVIYGALYVTVYYQALFLQGVLGYTAAAAGLAWLPSTLMLTLLSARIGALSGRYGPRVFMTLGPLLMSAGLLWLLRVPVTSAAWRLRPGDPGTFLPPLSYLVDFLPSGVVYGLGISILVAPLTTAVMASVPTGNAGIASALNNAVSRVGPQLAGAAIFVAVTAVFYQVLSAHAGGVDTTSPALRRLVSPLNPPAPGAPHQLAAAAPLASTDAFHLAIGICVALILAGALINLVGIHNPTRRAP